MTVRKIAEVLHPHKIILFGSYTYGTPTPDSDVDLLVMMETIEARQASRTRPASRLLFPRLFAMDIWVKTPKEMSTAQKKGDFFIAEIMRQGKVVYERPRLSSGLGCQVRGRLFCVARSTLRRKRPSTSIACFHAQQCVEKYIKTILVSPSKSFPRIHDLLKLSTLCEQASYGPSIRCCCTI